MLISYPAPKIISPPRTINEAVGNTKSIITTMSTDTNCFDVSDDSIFTNIAPEIDTDYKLSDDEDEDDSDNSVNNRDDKKYHNSSFRTLSNISIIPQINYTISNLSDNEFDLSPTTSKEDKMGNEKEDIIDIAVSTSIKYINLNYFI